MTRRNPRNLQRKPDYWQPVITTLAGVLVLSVLFLALAGPLRQAARRFFYPFRVLSHRAAAALSEDTRMLRSRSELAAAVAELEKQNAQLQLDNAESLRLRRENAQLRQLLKLPAPLGFRLLSAGVIQRDPLHRECRFTIDRGTREGVQPGLAVLCGFGDSRSAVPVLAGVIVSATPYTAEVMTILGHELQISAALPESRTVGFLNTGDEPERYDLAVLGYLPAEATFALNEPLYTTGYEPQIPAGVLIGTLAQIRPNPRPFGGQHYRSGGVRMPVAAETLCVVAVALPIPEENAPAPAADGTGGMQ